MMMVGVLYICTGKYNMFFNDFYYSCEKYFLPRYRKQYFVFTDNENLTDAPNVKIIKKECLGFPKDSLFHFDFFLQVKEQLKAFDYVFYFNSNALFLKEVNDGYLPSEKEGYLLGAEWVVWKDKSPFYFPYERRKESKAYIEPRKPPYHYYMGGVIGGRSKEFLEMSEILANNIRDDYKRGIIARFHDESHVNRFFRDHKCKVLTPEYCMPEEWVNGNDMVMILRNKSRLSTEFDIEKGRNRSFVKRVCNYIRKQLVALQWYF